jgi:hypothetical protein
MVFHSFHHQALLHRAMEHSFHQFLLFGIEIRSLLVIVTQILMFQIDSEILSLMLMVDIQILTFVIVMKSLMLESQSQMFQIGIIIFVIGSKNSTACTSIIDPLPI